MATCPRRVKSQALSPCVLATTKLLYSVMTMLPLVAGTNVGALLLGAWGGWKGAMVLGVVVVVVVVVIAVVGTAVDSSGSVVDSALGVSEGM